MGSQYSISALAKEFDITTRTIRFYEDIGILSPTREGTQRVYNQQDRTLLKLTLRGKRLGLSLDECKALFDLYDPVGDNNQKQLQTCLDKFQEQKTQLQNQFHDMQVMMLELDNAIDRVKAAMHNAK